MTHLVIAFLSLVVGSGVGWWFALRLGGPAGTLRDREGRGDREELTDAPFGRVVARDATRDRLAAALREDPAIDPADARRQDQRILANALTLVADQLGAHDASLWAAAESEGGAPILIARSAGDGAPALSEMERELVRWTAGEEIISFDRQDGVLGFAVVPVPLAAAGGALALHFDRDAAISREVLANWLPRHAGTLAALHEVLRNRADVARGNFQVRAALRAAMKLQGTLNSDELEAMFAQQSLEVAGAEWAFLVRWSAESQSGEIRAATKQVPTPEVPVIVHRDSMVGIVCDGGRPLIYEDARALLAEGGSMTESLPIPKGTSSLIVIPLRRSEEQRALGALVCGHGTVRAFRANDARTARDLGVIASGALQTAWAVEDARAVARTDPLTGLANRRKFDEAFAHAVEWANRHEGTWTALVLADVDFFKKVNDTYGHEAGDLVLVAVARALAKDRRAVDVVARIGGEELALILPNVTVDGAREVAERLRERVEKIRVTTSMGEIRVSASFGVALYRARAGNSSMVFQQADKALYAAKRNGRNRVEVASEGGSA